MKGTSEGLLGCRGRASRGNRCGGRAKTGDFRLERDMDSSMSFQEREKKEEKAPFLTLEGVGRAGALRELARAPKGRCCEKTIRGGGGRGE